MMDLRIKNGLLLASCTLVYGGQKAILHNVLLDTGCAVSIFDIDLMEDLGLMAHPEKSRIVKMYGIGGKSDSCLECHVQDLVIDGHECRHFQIQLGPISYDYGFDAILGNDFLQASGLTIDLGHLTVFEQKSAEYYYLN